MSPIETLHHNDKFEQATQEIRSFITAYKHTLPDTFVHSAIELLSGIKQPMQIPEQQDQQQTFMARMGTFYAHLEIIHTHYHILFPYSETTKDAYFHFGEQVDLLKDAVRNYCGVEKHYGGVAGVSEHYPFGDDLSPQDIFRKAVFDTMIKTIPDILDQDISFRKLMTDLTPGSETCPIELVVLSLALKEYNNAHKNPKRSQSQQSTDDFTYLFDSETSPDPIGNISGDGQGEVAGTSIAVFMEDPIDEFKRLDTTPKLRAAYAVFAAINECKWATYYDLYPELTRWAQKYREYLEPLSAIIQSLESTDYHLSFTILTVMSGKWALQEIPNAPQWAQEEIALYTNNPLLFKQIFTSGPDFKNWKEQQFRFLDLSPDELKQEIARIRKNNPDNPLFKNDTTLTDMIKKMWRQKQEEQRFLQWKTDKGYVNTFLNPDDYLEQEQAWEKEWQAELTAAWEKDSPTIKHEAIKRWLNLATSPTEIPDPWVRKKLQFMIRSMASILAANIIDNKNHILKYRGGNNTYNNFVVNMKLIKNYPLRSMREPAIDSQNDQVENAQSDTTISGYTLNIARQFLDLSRKFDVKHAAKEVFGPQSDSDITNIVNWKIICNCTEIWETFRRQLQDLVLLLEATEVKDIYKVAPNTNGNSTLGFWLN